MDTPLLTTKTNIPAAGNKLVARRRLLEHLDESLLPENLLTLVCSPAGYGKTTLIATWLHARISEPHQDLVQETGMLPAWLTLDEGDNDPVRFLSYLVAALSKKNPDFGKGLLAGFQAQRQPSVEITSTRFVNELAEIQKPIVMVLDDFHVIDSQTVRDFMRFLVANQPGNLSLIIASRADPDLPLARLRARGQLTEIRQRDLAFSLQESVDFFKNVIGINLSPAQIEALDRRTEGWAAGLKLAALSLRGAQDTESFIKDFSGGYEHIANYLADEVLSRQPKPIRTFLLRTAILDRFNIPLCQAVTEQVNARSILEHIKDENLFLESLDHQGEWYRYHRLFRDLLLARLEQVSPGLSDELHQRACRWYHENGLKAAAVEHALHGHDYQYAMDLIEQTGEAVLQRSEGETLLRWLDGIPEAQQRRHPAIYIYRGLALMLSGKPIDEVVAQVELHASGSETEKMAGERSTLRSLHAVLRGDSTQAILHARQALAYLPPGSSFFRCLAADSLGMAYSLTGDTDLAIDAFEQVVETAWESGNTMMALTALSNLAGLQILQGQLRAAQTSYQRILDLAEEKLGKRAPATGKALLGLGMLAREWNDLESALSYYRQGSDMLRQMSEIGLPIAHLSIAMVKANQQDWPAAYEALEQARQLALQSTSTPLDDRLTEETQVRFWIAQGELNSAQRWLDSNGFSAESLIEHGPHPPTEFLINQVSYLLLIRFYLANKDPEHALAVIEPLLDFFKSRGYLRRVIETMALQALAYQGMRDQDAALRVLESALRLGKPDNYQRTFLDEGENMMQLVYSAIEARIHPEYAGQLFSAFTKEPGLSKMPNAAKPDPLVEPLSDRELEVLACLAEGLSNNQIAARLYISLSTVKGHTSHIYGKLGVNNRTRAVALGRGLGLLPSE